MVLSIPLSVITSRESLGQAFRGAGLFLTPEESSAPDQLARLNARLGDDQSSTIGDGLIEAVLDPYINAIHVSLLRERQPNPQTGESAPSRLYLPERIKAFAQRLLAHGSSHLSAEEQLALMTDADTMAWLHHHAWMSAPEKLAPAWRTAFSEASAASK
jgi:membrane glycosyltransferase